jgi:hypothetical protein
MIISFGNIRSRIIANMAIVGAGPQQLPRFAWFRRKVLQISESKSYDGRRKVLRVYDEQISELKELNEQSFRRKVFTKFQESKIQETGRNPSQWRESSSSPPYWW